MAERPSGNATLEPGECAVEVLPASPFWPTWSLPQHIIPPSSKSTQVFV